MPTNVPAPHIVATAVTTAGALAPGKLNRVDATSGALTMTLPAAATANAGARLTVEKTDASANIITISGSIRGATSSVSLYWQNESVDLIADSTGSWYPAGGHKTKKSLDSAYLQGLGPATSDDTATINGALNAARIAGGGVVRGMPGQQYNISARLVIGSNVTLDMTGCGVTLLTNSLSNMVTTYAEANPSAVATDGAVTTGSNVVTTALGASAVVGQTLWVAGAGGNGTGPLLGIVTAQTATTITINKISGGAANATATVSAAKVRLFTRDFNLQVLGGRWRRGANGPDSGTGGVQGSAIAGHSFYLAHANNVTIDLEYVSSTHGITFVWVTDCAHWSVSVHDGNVVRTLVQVVGPIYDGQLPFLRGTTSDDFLNICGNVYTDQTDSCGDVVDVTFGTIVGNTGNNSTLMKINPGQGNIVTGVRGGRITGSTSLAVSMMQDTVQAPTTGGTLGYIDLGLIDATPSIRAVNVGIDTRMLLAKVIVASGSNTGVNFAAGAIQTANIELDANGAVDNVVVFSGATVNNATISGQINSSTALAMINMTGATAFVHELRVRVAATFTGNPAQIFGGTHVAWHIDRLVLDDCTVTWSSTAGNNAAFMLDGGGGLTIDEVEVRGGVYTGGASAVRTSNAVPFKRVVIGGDVRFVNCDRVVVLSVGTSVNILLGRIISTGQLSPHFAFTGTSTYNVFGGEVIAESGTGTTFTSGTSLIKTRSPALVGDVTAVSKMSGGALINSNASAACGVGPVICDGTNWKNLFTGATYAAPQ